MQLTNLNEMQKALCEILWELDDSKEVANFLDGLPIRIRQDAHNMIELMMLEKIDEKIVENDDNSFVNSFSSRKDLL